MTSTLQWNILTTLINEDRSWTEIKKELKCSTTHLSNSLKELEKNKIIEQHTLERDGGPGRKTSWTHPGKTRKVWSITQHGRELIQNGQLDNHQ